GRGSLDLRFVPAADGHVPAAPQQGSSDGETDPASRSCDQRVLAHLHLRFDSDTNSHFRLVLSTLSEGRVDASRAPHDSLHAQTTPSASLTGRGTTMYIHHMVRTQLYLEERLHARLRDLARKQGRTISDL